MKEPKFEIDGVFLPPDDRPGVVYYGEVQFQKDERLYERVVSESSNHFYRNRDKFSDWQAVIIYPSRKIEQKDTHPFRALINSDQFHRIYLDELADVRELPIGLALMKLTIEKPKNLKETAKYLVERTRNEVHDSQTNQAIIEMVTTVVVYAFNKLSRAEVEKMLGVDITLQETRFYQDVKAEGKVEGEESGQRSLLTLLLDRKFGKLPQKVQDSIANLALPQLEALALALLDFGTIDDLKKWLKQN